MKSREDYIVTGFFSSNSCPSKSLPRLLERTVTSLASSPKCAVATSQSLFVGCPQSHGGSSATSRSPSILRSACEVASLTSSETVRRCSLFNLFCSCLRQGVIRLHFEVSAMQNCDRRSRELGLEYSVSSERRHMLESLLCLVLVAQPNIRIFQTHVPLVVTA